MLDVVTLNHALGVVGELAKATPPPTPKTGTGDAGNNLAVSLGIQGAGATIGIIIVIILMLTHDGKERFLLLIAVIAGAMAGASILGLIHHLATWLANATG